MNADVLRAILLVEDDDAIREVVSDVLADEGFDVSAARNGQEALDYLSSCVKLPDAIVLDLMMPIMNGWDFCAEQRKDPRISRIPVVVLSADGAIASAAKELEAAAFVKKPVRIDRLVTVLTSVIR